MYMEVYLQPDPFQSGTGSLLFELKMGHEELYIMMIYHDNIISLWEWWYYDNSPWDHRGGERERDRENCYMFLFMIPDSPPWGPCNCRSHWLVFPQCHALWSNATRLNLRQQQLQWHKSLFKLAFLGGQKLSGSMVLLWTFLLCPPKYNGW